MALHVSHKAVIGQHEAVEVGGSMITPLAAKALALLRIAIGFTFLWAFLDKTFGLGYSTAGPALPGKASKAWIDGGSPTKGFLSNVHTGPFQSTFHSLAGNAIVDWLFMLGLLGVGVAMMAGVAVRIAAIAGTAMVAMMWLAEFPPAQSNSLGVATKSVNPFLDDHVLEALVLIVVAVTYAGTTWGFGKIWARLPFVHSHTWML